MVVSIGVGLVVRLVIGSSLNYWVMGGDVAGRESIWMEKVVTCRSALKRRVNHDWDRGRSLSDRERHTPGKRRMGVHRCHPCEVASFSDLVSEVVSSVEGLRLDPKVRLARGRVAVFDRW